MAKNTPLPPPLKPRQYSVLIKTTTGLAIMEECERRNISFSSFLDYMCEQAGPSILTTSNFPKTNFVWPPSRGVRGVRGK